jgi:xylan 1,4-beta-xylosidase
LHEGKRQVFLRKLVDAQLVEPVVYADAPAGPITLIIKAAPLTYTFVFKSDTGEEQVLGEAVTKDLSVERIGFKDGMCFTGVYFGLYATGNGQPCSVPADFDWFEYTGKN